MESEACAVKTWLTVSQDEKSLTVVANCYFVLLGRLMELLRVLGWWHIMYICHDAGEQLKWLFLTKCRDYETTAEEICYCDTDCCAVLDGAPCDIWQSRFFKAYILVFSCVNKRCCNGLAHPEVGQFQFTLHEKTAIFGPVFVCPF